MNFLLFRTKNMCLPRPVCILLLLLLGGCATAPQKPAYMASAPGVHVEPAELRVRVYVYESFFASTVQSSANEILAKEEDFEIRQAALLWKINVIPAMQKAVFQADPLAALGEAWVLTLQMARYFDEGPGRDLFGESQSIAVEAAHDLESEVQAVALSIGDPTAAAEIKRDFEQWVEDNPILDINFGRRSVMTDASAVTARALGVGGLTAVGQMDETLRDIADRLTIYTEQLPKQARWHAELVIAEAYRQFGEKLTRDIDSIETSAEGLDTFFNEKTPELISSEREAVVREFRRELNELLAEERVIVLEALKTEREVILGELDRQLKATLAALRQERIETTAELDDLAARTLEQSALEARVMTDHFFRRVLQLLLVALVGVLVIGLVLRLVGRRARAA